MNDTPVYRLSITDQENRKVVFLYENYLLLTQNWRS